MKKRLLGLLVGLWILPLSLCFAQSGDPDVCPAIVAAALAAVDSFCTETGRNQICYGNFQIEFTPQAEVGEVTFNQIGDIVDVGDIASLQLSPMDTENGYWGVVLMQLQANLPDTLPGQNVTFLLFGDVSVTSAVSPEQLADGEFNPLQAFYLTTGIGDSQCAEAPDSGLLVQTPEGVGQISFIVNEVEVQMGSTVLFQAGSEQQLTASTLEGVALLKSGGLLFPVIAGTHQNLSLESLQALTRLTEYALVIPPEVYSPETINALPLGLLGRAIRPQSAPDAAALEEFYTWVEDWNHWTKPDCVKTYPTLAESLCGLLTGVE